MAAFVDTNVLLYAFSNANGGDARKVEAANRVIERLIRAEELILSAQVLNEFISVATRKGTPPLTLQEAAQIVERLVQYTVIAIDSCVIQLALHRVQQSRISYWDALIVEAALRSGASILYTEDMHHGTRYSTLQLENSFLA